MVEQKTFDEILSDPENLKCGCFKTECELHGKCRECVAAHRYYKGVPVCMGEFVKKD